LGAVGLTGAGALETATAGTGALAAGFAGLAGGFRAAAVSAALAAFGGAAGVVFGILAAGTFSGFALLALGVAALDTADGLTACAFTCCLLAESAGGGVSPCALVSGCARDCSGWPAPGNMILNREANMKT